MATSSTGGRGQSSVTACLVGKSPEATRQGYFGRRDGRSQTITTRPSEAEESPEGEEHNADEAVLPGHDQHGPHVDDQARAEHGHAGPEAPGSESREGYCVSVLLGGCADGLTPRELGA